MVHKMSGQLILGSTLGTDTIPQKLFNDQGSSYDAVVRNTTFNLDEVWKQSLLSKLPNINGKDVLDVACGTGLLSIKLSDNGAHVYGIDITEDMLKYAKQRFSDQGRTGEFQIASANELPYPNEMFDAVVSCYVPKYCDVEQHVAESYRVLKPGGVFAEYDFSAPKETLDPMTWAHAVYYRNMKNISKAIKPFDKDENYTMYFEVLEDIIEQSNWEERMITSLKLNGFRNILEERLISGAVTLITAIK